MTDRSDSESPADQAPLESKPDAHGDASNAAAVASGAEGQPDESRSGADVGESIDIAESGTRAQGDHSHPERAKTGEAPVEQVFNDPAMTEGQRTAADSGTTQGMPPGPSPAEAGSGGAQSVVGARESDRLAAGEPPAAGAPFETGAKARPSEQGDS